MKSGEKIMTFEEKQRLLDLLTDSYDKCLTSVKGVDPELQVNPETDWRIRDIIGCTSSEHLGQNCSVS
jgi:hypothetical protein